MNLKTIFLLLVVAVAVGLNSFASDNLITLQTQDNSEHEAIFNDQTDFTPNSDGFVIIHFTLTSALTSQEQAEVDELRSENTDRIDIQQNGLDITVKLVGNLSNSGVWNKVFYTMGITQYTFGNDPDQKKQPFDIFANQFNIP